MLKISALVPLKLNSRRLPNKNFLMLGGKPLAVHIFDTLSTLSELSSIYCFTSQSQVMDLLPEDVELLIRPNYLDGDEVKGNELFGYAVDRIDADIIVLCHATGPFITGESISKGIKAVVSGEYDSAFSVVKHQSYAWFGDQPINYNPSDMIQTQLLTPVMVETSGFYIFKKDNYLRYGNRIGKNPFMVPVSFKESVDIDNPEDFSLATALLGFDERASEAPKKSYFVDYVNKIKYYSDIQHIIFDLDGVLVDTVQVMEKAWNSVCIRFSLTIPFAEYKKYIGFPFFDILAKLSIPEDLFDDIEKLYTSESLKLIDQVEIFPGVKESLILLKNAGLRLTIATSKNRLRTELLLDKLGIDAFFDKVVTPDDLPLGRGKPCPDSLLSCCLAVRSDPEKSIFIGDMDVDREASQRAGTQFVYAAWGFAKLSVGSDLWFSSFTDFADYIIAEYEIKV